MIDDQDALMRNSEPVPDSEKDSREVDSRDKDRPLWERWEDWATVVDR